jgi:predicted nucleic acid-binding Zn ribbon protein
MTERKALTWIGMAKPQKIKLIVADVMASLTKGELEPVRKHWQALLGEDAAKHAVPVSTKKGRLLVEVDSSVWLQHLTMRKLDILQKLKDVPLDKPVEDIRFRHGKGSGYGE